MEVIILTGGMGTRLKTRIKDIPKTMADVNGIPFLERTLEWLNNFEISNVILAVGYKKEYIKEYFGTKYKNFKITYSEETSPLGTGGAIKRALQKTTDENVIVMNGDVFVRFDISKIYEKHLNDKADMSIAIKEMQNFDRFGIVKFENNRIISFEEKKFTEKGFMNAGVYVLNRNIFKGKIKSESFSVENDYLNKYVLKDFICPYIYDGEFIDIGIPEDYDKIIKILK